MAITSKKGFVFSLLALFISFLIFAFAASQFDRVDYTQESTFAESRITSVNEEIEYFLGVYLPSSFAFSTYNVMDSLINYTGSDNPLTEHSELNRLVLEGLVNGSFDSVIRSELNERTVSYLVQEYINNFNGSYLANMTVEYGVVNVYEEQPFHISLDYNVSVNVTTQDNISSWILQDTNSILVPIYGIYDPQFLFKGGDYVDVQAAELFVANVNWDETSFNQTVQNMYGSIFFNPSYKYTLGQSFLTRLFNETQSDYLNVTGFWNFDYDEEEGKVYDNSAYSLRGVHYGNSRLVMDFEAVESTTVYDNQSYLNIGTVSGATYSNSTCLTGGCFEFDGVNDEITVPDADHLDLLDLEVVSLVFSINTTSDSALEHIFSKGGDSSEGILVGTNNATAPGSLFAQIHDGSNSVRCVSTENYTTGSFVHVAILFDRADDNLSIYRNGLYSTSCDISSISDSTIDNSQDVSISDSSNSFEGTLDELALYSKELSGDEIIYLYNEGRVSQIDYVDSMFGKGVEFDGIDDYVTLDQFSFNQNNADYAVELWFKPYSENTNKALFGIRYNDAGTNYLLLTMTGSNSLGFRSTQSVGGEDVLFANYSGSIVNRYNHIIIQQRGSTKEIYLNSRLLNSSSVSGVLESFEDDNITFAADIDVGDDYNQFFEGIIDEVKIYNRSLSSTEIENNYFNFDGASKGCCNYITLINPNTFGYNTTGFDDNVSFSSAHFYDFYIDAEYKNITLYNITNFTSTTTDNNYYNFRVDLCLLQAFSIFDFALTPDPQTYKAVDGTNTCEDLIRLGYY